MAYEDDRNVSENQRQVDKAATPTSAGHKAADIAHYTRLLAAGRKWSVKNGSFNALLSLGQNPGGGQNGDS